MLAFSRTRSDLVEIWFWVCCHGTRWSVVGGLAQGNSWTLMLYSPREKDWERDSMSKIDEHQEACLADVSSILFRTESLRIDLRSPKSSKQIADLPIAEPP